MFPYIEEENNHCLAFCTHFKPNSRYLSDTQQQKHVQKIEDWQEDKDYVESIIHQPALSHRWRKMVLPGSLRVTMFLQIGIHQKWTNCHNIISTIKQNLYSTHKIKIKYLKPAGFTHATIVNALHRQADDLCPLYSKNRHVKISRNGINHHVIRYAAYVSLTIVHCKIRRSKQIAQFKAFFTTVQTVLHNNTRRLKGTQRSIHQSKIVNIA